jgi:hypothetical protein
MSAPSWLGRRTTSRSPNVDSCPTLPADEQLAIHWKQRLAVTAAGIGVLGATGAGLGKAIAAIRRQGTSLNWEERT